MNVSLKDLSNAELDWLKKLNVRNGMLITKDMSDRLISLGLAKEGLGGTIISEAGKRLLASKKASE